MVDVLAQLFGVIGFDIIPPTNLYEFCPYLIKIVLAFLLISWCLSFFRSLASMASGGRL